jgi:cation transport ATPase
MLLRKLFLGLKAWPESRWGIFLTLLSFAWLVLYPFGLEELMPTFLWSWVGLIFALYAAFLSYRTYWYAYRDKREEDWGMSMIAVIANLMFAIIFVLVSFL